MTAMQSEIAQTAPPTAISTRRNRWSAHDLNTSVFTGRGALYLPRHVTLATFGGIVLLIGVSARADIRYSLVISTVYAIAILGNNAVHAVLGEMNLSAGAFIALGAYITANGFAHHWPVLLIFTAATLGCGLVGAIFALPAMRLRGMSTALVTFALAYSITDLATFFNSFTGGDAGMYLPANVGVGGMTFSGSSKGMLLLVVVLMIVVGFIHLAMLHSRSGRIAISVGEAESAAAVFATRVRWVKLAVWAWAAALAGLAGVLYGLSVGYVTASQWQVNLTIFVLVGGLIGGSRSASGAWIGGLLVGGLPILLQTVVPVAATYIAYGAILLGALLVGGKGLAEFVERGFVWAYVVIRRPR